ncbi:insulinoma-associated protein (ia-1)-related [Schistosoma mansoni]|uniref:insulinoma-associated protein (ia-1)-related n=1 Tax=Schistosoma mansoni TaxID=6183 RepID=UPI00022DC68E|nr:insulinoma-associated protein (ia-1)-related [Schistosoma mansoni]|eukprot:XP_018648392.1 insulinoma-associated protein (ia-1)-related [Schistosoma mansoni]
MSFKPNFKSNYGNANHNLETQTKIINFFNTYKQLLDGYTRHIMNKLHHTTSFVSSNTSCGSNIGNNTVEFMSYDSLQDHQNITNVEPNTVCSFKSPIISSYKNLKLKSYSSTTNPMNSTSKYPCFNDFCLTANNSQYKSNDFIKTYFQTLSSFPLSNCDSFKTQHDPSINSRSKLSISRMNEDFFKNVQPSTTLSLFSSSSVTSLSNKLSMSPLTTLTNTTATSSNSSSPSLSVDSIDIKTNIPKHLTVQKILKRLAKLPNNLGPYICRLCNQYFENALKLANHRCPLILHTDYRCPECDKNELNSMVFHQKQGNRCNQFVINSNCIRKPTFTVQAILEDSFNNNYNTQSKITRDNNNLTLNFDETIINVESPNSTDCTESNKINLNLSTTYNSSTNDNNDNIHATNNMCNIKQELINQQISLQCNYCNTPLSTRSELETHMVEHIFSRIKSEIEEIH